MGAFAMLMSALENISATCRIYRVNTRKLTAQELRRSFESFFDEQMMNMCEQMCVCLPACSIGFEKFFQERLHLLFSDRVDVN